ncbi:MAG: enhanced intracellular survival protein Eis [Armatimonadota bacterium]
MASTAAPHLQLPPQPVRHRLPEVRGADSQERAAAWRLQRAAFNLEGEAPPAHPGSSDELRVVALGDRVVSCLTLLRAELRIRGAAVPLGGIRHVATDPEQQNQGYASALIRDSLRHLRAQGVPASVLFPFSFRYYRKFGYELGGNHCHFWSRPNCLPAFSERRTVRLAQPEDVPRLTRFYTERLERATCALARPEPRWQRVCGDPVLTTRCVGENRIDGYLISTEARDNYGGRVLRVLEMDAASPRAWRALIGSLSEFGGESIEWHADSVSLCASGLLHSTAPLREGFKPRSIVTTRPMFQFRVVDLPGMLRLAAETAGAMPGALCFRISDDALPENSEPVTVSHDGARVHLRPDAPAEPYLESSIQVFSQLACGYLSPSEAVSQELARVSGEGALELADQLFPAGEPFISELDRF